MWGQHPFISCPKAAVTPQRNPGWCRAGCSPLHPAHKEWGHHLHPIASFHCISLTASPKAPISPPRPVSYGAAHTLTHIPIPSFRDTSWVQSAHLTIWEAIVHPPHSLFKCLCKFSKDISRPNYTAKYYGHSLYDRLIILWVLLSEASHNPIISSGSQDGWGRGGGGGIAV